MSFEQWFSQLFFVLCYTIYTQWSVKPSLDDGKPLIWKKSNVKACDNKSIAILETLILTSYLYHCNLVFFLLEKCPPPQKLQLHQLKLYFLPLIFPENFLTCNFFSFRFWSCAQKLTLKVKQINTRLYLNSVPCNHH